MTSEEKQHTPEFERCIEEVLAQGHEKGNAFAICTATFQRAGKPIFAGEAISPRCYYMIGELKHDFIQPGDNRVYGQAIHPMKTYHPNEFPEFRVYLEEELQKAAETLIGKPFGMDHLYLLPEPNHITKAWYADDAVNFEGIVNDNVKKMIENGEIKVSA